MWKTLPWLFILECLCALKYANVQFQDCVSVTVNLAYCHSRCRISYTCKLHSYLNANMQISTYRTQFFRFPFWSHISTRKGEVKIRPVTIYCTTGVGQDVLKCILCGVYKYTQSAIAGGLKEYFSPPFSPSSSSLLSSNP